MGLGPIADEPLNERAEVLQAEAAIGRNFLSRRTSPNRERA
jgi:hypothetical protein